MICLDDKFNKTTKKETECLFCHERICRTCLKQTLLNDTATDICCPGCRVVWSQDFIIANLPASFRTKEFKAHRENVLYDHERVHLQLYMDDARRYKDAVALSTRQERKLRKYKERYEALPEVVARAAARTRMYIGLPPHEHANACADYCRADSAVNNTPSIVNLRLKIRLLKRGLRASRFTVLSFGLERPVRGAGAGAGAGAAAPQVQSQSQSQSQSQRKRRIIMACPATDCAGFVDTLWKCGICDTAICKDCRVVKLDEHACNADDVATARALDAETKPCPKCSAPISKVSGCDQMWCTVCHTTFSWNTGKVETTVVHNPHYFQWLATTGRTIPRADLPGMACDIDGNTLRTIVNMLHDATPDARVLLDYISRHHRQRLHAENVLLPFIRDKVRVYNEGNWRRPLCVKRLAGELTDDGWRTVLQRTEKAYHKERAWVQLTEMYVLATRDILGRITQADPDLAAIVDEHKKLHAFTYEQNRDISKAYGCVILKITEDMDPPAPKKRVAVGGAGAATADADD
jgi:hypothetical protein